MLESGDIRQVRQSAQRARIQWPAGAVRDVVDHQRHRADLGQPPEMFDHSGLRRFGVVRHHRQRTRGPRIQYRQLPLGFRSRIATCTDEQRRAAIEAHLGAHLDHRLPLHRGEGGGFGGGAQCHDAGRTSVQSLRRQPREHVVGGFVTVGEGGYQGDEEAAEGHTRQPDRGLNSGPVHISIHSIKPNLCSPFGSDGTGAIAPHPVPRSEGGIPLWRDAVRGMLRRNSRYASGSCFVLRCLDGSFDSRLAHTGCGREPATGTGVAQLP